MEKWVVMGEGRKGGDGDERKEGIERMEVC